MPKVPSEKLVRSSPPNGQVSPQPDNKKLTSPSSPVPDCSSCRQPMFRFTAKGNGRPYIKCDTCDILRSERDTRIPSCYCGLTAKLRVSRTPANPGRKFRGCGKLVSARDKCKFFDWVPV